MTCISYGNISKNESGSFRVAKSQWQGTHPNPTATGRGSALAICTDDRSKSSIVPSCSIIGGGPWQTYCETAQRPLTRSQTSGRAQTTVKDEHRAAVLDATIAARVSAGHSNDLLLDDPKPTQSAARVPVADGR
jgi:hypothetical protein